MKDNNLQIAITAALEAGERIMEIYATDNFDIDFKSDNTPLTKADLAANDIILDRLKSTGIPILSEEGKSILFEERRAWKHLWIVDPIDGTKEFIKRNGEFTVNIALIENQVPIAGVVLVPALKELYFSSIELGAFKTKDLRPNLTVEERVESAKRLPESKNERGYTVVASRSHLSEETVAFITDLEEKHGSVERLSKGSSLKLCMVAEGSADCYPRFAPTMEWDTAAGHAICNHSGCTVINWETKLPLLYNRENLLNPWFLVERVDE